MGDQIVVVDDEADILVMLSEVLRSEGYEAIAFVNPARALEHCLAVPPALVITDLVMPVISGQELIWRLRQHYGPTLSIMVMSASVNMAAVTSLPIQAFVSKPFDLDDLLDRMRHLLIATPAAVAAHTYSTAE